MNQRMVAEFSAMVAAQAPLLVEGTGSISDGPLWVYWQHSKTMLSRWRRAVDEAVSQPNTGDSAELIAIASNILVAEMLTRVWGAVLVASDERQIIRRAAPIAKNVLTAHQQSRASVLRMLVHSSVLPIEQLAELDRLRRRVERWTDVLLGPLVVRYGDLLAPFAFDLRRAKDFGEGQTGERFQTTAQPAWSFLMAGLRSAFHQSRPVLSSHTDPMQPILNTILATFPDGAFQSEGPIKSLRLARISRSSEKPESAPIGTPTAGRFLRHDMVRSSQSAQRRSSRPPLA